MRDLKGIGAHNAATSRKRGLLGKGGVAQNWNRPTMRCASMAVYRPPTR